MIKLFQDILKPIKKWYYYQEFKEISLVILIAATGFLIYNYGTTVAQFIFSQTGLLWAAFVLVAINLALTLQMFYRIMVIKYHEKSTEIELFKFLNEKK